MDFKKEVAVEKITPNVGQSFSIRKFDETAQNSEPFWHMHPEIEIVYINKGSGTRHIGRHLGNYINGDLIMIGSNLPHYGFTNRFTKYKSEVVIQFREDFLGKDLFASPEMLSIGALFHKAKNGISFSGNTLTQVGERLESMFYMSHFEKAIELIKILKALSTSRDATILNAYSQSLIHTDTSTSRMDDVYKYVAHHFQDEISLDDVCELINMSVTSFCRFFKKNTGKTFVQYLNEFRIIHACKLLSEGTMSVTDVCFDSGYNNFSHFNRNFKKQIGKSPSEYRKEMKLEVLRY